MFPKVRYWALFCFIFFINDIFDFVNNCDLYNYADDNTLSCSDTSISTVKQNLEADNKWFDNNKMKANPNKCPAIAIANKTNKAGKTFQLDGNTIVCKDEVILLGVTIDFKLKFNAHISKICKKVSRQLNVKRIGNYLCKLGKLNIYYSFIL